MEPTISCVELLLRLGDDDLLVLDCRDPETAGHLSSLTVPGALRIPLDDLRQWGRSLPDDELIVIVGEDAGLARRACRLLHQLDRMGVVLDGGLHAWVSAGFPVEGRPTSQEYDKAV